MVSFLQVYRLKSSVYLPSPHACHMPHPSYHPNQYTSCSYSLRSFLQSTVPSSLSGPNTPSAPYTRTLSACVLHYCITSRFTAPPPKWVKLYFSVPYCFYLLTLWAGTKLSIYCHKLDASRTRKLSAVPVCTGCPHGTLVLSLSVPAVLTPKAIRLRQQRLYNRQHCAVHKLRTLRASKPAAVSVVPKWCEASNRATDALV